MSARDNNWSLTKSFMRFNMVLALHGSIAFQGSIALFDLNNIQEMYFNPPKFSSPASTGYPTKDWTHPGKVFLVLKEGIVVMSAIAVVVPTHINNN